jgi:AbrB family looped-hinge helix DNA binding protein
MKTTIDKAGRVVIPAAMRERVGLKPGVEVEILEEDFTVRLVPRVPRPQVVRVGRRLVVRPTAPPEERRPLDPAALVEEERDRWP